MDSKSYQINFVDATPGTGKTEAAVRFMARHILKGKGGIVLYVAPTVELLERVKNERLIPMLREKGATPRQLSAVHLFSSHEYSESVVTVIRRALEGSSEAKGNITLPPEDECVALITHAAFFRLPLALRNRDNIDVIFDEARKCVFEPIRVELTFQEMELFSKFLIEEPSTTGPYSKLAIDSDPELQSELTALLEKWKQKQRLTRQAFGRFRDMIEAIQLRTTDVYCMRQASGERKGMLKFYEVHLPSRVFDRWRSVHIMSAYLQQTQLWAMLCRGMFSLNGKLCNMHQQRSGKWTYDQPRRRQLVPRYDLVDVTKTFIPDYEKRERKILKRYKQATIVTLTGRSDVEPNPRMLISSSRLSSVFVKSAKAAERHTREFEELYGNAKVKLGAADLRRILYPAEDTKEQLSDFARELRQWMNNIKKAAPAPYLWYLRAGLQVAEQWFDSEYASPIPLLLINKTYGAALKRKYPEYLRKVRILPHSCHGRDDFKDHCMILFQAATNPTPEARSFYEAHIPWYDYNQDHIVETALQAATRTSIRDTTNKEPVLIVVPDPYLAKLLSEKLGGVRIEYARDRYGVEPVYVVKLRKPYTKVADNMKKYRKGDKAKQTRREYEEAQRQSPFYKKYRTQTSLISRARSRNEPLDDLKAKAMELRSKHRRWMKENG